MIATHDLAPQAARRSRWPSLVRLAAVGVVLLALAAVVVVLTIHLAYDGRILPGVRVAGTSLAGLAPSEATALLDRRLAPLSDGTLVFESAAGSGSVAFSETGRRADVEAIVSDAFRHGRDGGPLGETTAAFRAIAFTEDLEVPVLVDADRIRAAASAVAGMLEMPPVDASVARTASGFAIVPGAAGHAVGIGSAVEEAVRLLSDPAAPATVTVRLDLVAAAPRVTAADAASAVAEAGRVARDVTIAGSTASWKVTAAQVRAGIRIGPDGRGGLAVAVDRATIHAAVKAIAPKAARAAVNASYLVGRSGDVVGVRPGRDGEALEVERTTDAVMTALAGRALGSPAAKVPAVIVATSPTLTTAEATRIAPLMARLGRWTTYYQVGAHNGYGANITIPARTLNGTIVGPGETFDFWRALGEVSLATGYRMGGAIVNGHSVEGKALAGGICAASTTLFNAAVRAGYPIVARSPHWYAIARYPLGLDATVSESQSMRFRNDTRYPILIRGFASPGVVRFEVWSVPSGRTATFAKPVVKNVVRGYDTVQYTSSLATGVRQRIEWPVDGKDVWVTRTVRAADGTVIRHDTFYSHYHRMVGIVLVGTG